VAGTVPVTNPVQYTTTSKLVKIKKTSAKTKKIVALFRVQILNQWWELREKLQQVLKNQQL